MQALANAYELIQIFLERGGTVVEVIMWVTFAMWLLIFERVWYNRTAYKTEAGELIVRWKARTDKTSWRAEGIRQAMVSRVSKHLNQSLPVIKTLVGLCPLLGLMGTVTGMIEVFDSMAFFGSGNARAMAAGVSKATIPTMSGMVAALSGVFAVTFLNREASNLSILFEEQLTKEH